MNKENHERIVEIARSLLTRAGFDVSAKLYHLADKNSSSPILAIESEEDLGMLIGKNGQNLNALEHLIRLIAIRKVKNEDDDKISFILDINDYRKSKANYVIELAKKTAERVSQTQKAEALMPMSSYERRLIHAELALSSNIKTESIGEEPKRRVVIKPIL